MNDPQRVGRFVLRSEADKRLLYEFLKRSGEMLEQHGQFLSVVVAPYAPTRRSSQNARMWVGTLVPMEKQARMNGHLLPASSWHKIMKSMFLPEICAKGIFKWQYTDDGERKLTMSTGDLNEVEHDLYMHEVNAFATTELGVLLPVNPRDL